MTAPPQFQQVNSLTYIDVAALKLGLTRFPGEKAAAFLERCNKATTRRRDHSYEGTQDELCLQLGLDQWLGFSFASSIAGAVISCNVGMVTVTVDGNTTSIPTVTMAPDNYWEWKKLSKVVEELNAIAGITAVLLAEDGPALQIARQSNVLTVLNEAITSGDQILSHSGVVVSTMAFNMSLGAYQYDPDSNRLTIEDPPEGLRVSYQHLVLPYQVVCTEVGLFGLTEPSLASIGVGKDNTLAYQLQEAVQAVMLADSCYWAQ